MKRAHVMPFGAEVREDGSTRFRLWAPSAERLGLELLGPQTRAVLAMQPVAQGWHELVAEKSPPGTRYRFLLESGQAVPDPASRFNPQDVHGPSEVVDPGAHAWQDGAWQGRPWEEAVIYELHIGTFTPEGSFLAATDRLSELAALGITAIEIMPVAAFPGARNWGYDGVLPFAPDASYGNPRDLKALVDHAHGLGLMVLLDVVYNHFGPEGNYLHAYASQFFNPQHQTPWGAAINFDGENNRAVRDFFLHNALYWVEEFHFDGLRLDAIHAIRDDSAPTIVAEIAAALRDGPGRDRHVHLVLENDANEAHLLERDPSGAPLHASAQWNDDLHHAAHVLATGERDGYYADYADAPLARFGRALTDGFVYQGEPSTFRKGELRGEPSAHLPLSAFVSFLQSHDQVGNRALGQRIHALSDPVRERALLAALLLSPHVPMLFMGEEFAASTPFLFFCDFAAELARAVTEGRRREFAQFAGFSEASVRDRIPDPGDPATFEASKLRWGERAQGAHLERLELVRRLLALRHRCIVPHLDGTKRGARVQIVDGALRVEWALSGDVRLCLLFHPGPAPVTLPAPEAGETIFSSGLAGAVKDRVRLDPGAVCVWLASPDG